MYRRSIVFVTSSAAVFAVVFNEATLTPAFVGTAATLAFVNANPGVGGVVGPKPGITFLPPSNRTPSTTPATMTTPPTMRYAGLRREELDACRPSAKTPTSVRAARAQPQPLSCEEVVKAP